MENVQCEFNFGDYKLQQMVYTSNKNLVDYKIGDYKMVYTLSKNLVAEKINRLQLNGHDNVRLVMDFDFTITSKCRGIRGKVPNSFDLFTRSPSIPHEVKQDMFRLYQKYSKYEKNDTFDFGVRSEMLNRWCDECDKLFKGWKFDWQDINAITAECETYLRPGTKQLFELIYNREIPLFILSGGQGNCITGILKQGGIDVKAPVTIISNFLENSIGNLNGFKAPMVHPLNKSACLLETDEYIRSRDRKNIILVGDSLSDANMVQDETYPDANILKICYLNQQDEDSLQEYLEVFDVVLPDKEPMDFLINLIDQL